MSNPRKRLREEDEEWQLVVAREMLNAAAERDLDRLRDLVLNQVGGASLLDHSSSDDGATPLLLATTNQHMNMVRFLVSQGADVNIAANSNDPNASTPLVVALLRENLEMVRLFLENGADADSNTGIFGPSATWHGISTGNAEIVNLLLQHGVETEKVRIDAAGSEASALEIACRFDCQEIVDLLLDHGLDVNTESRYIYFDGDDPIPQASSWWPILAACKHGNRVIVRKLLDKHADVNVCDDDSCMTPLLFAIDSGDLDLVQLLLQKGAKLETSKYLRNPVKLPLVRALVRGKLDIAQALVDAGADINYAFHSYRVMTPLWVMSLKGNLPGARFLLKAGAVVALPETTTGMTPLFVASLKGHAAVVQELLKNGANAYTRSKKGNTCIWVAYAKGHTDVVFLLLRGSPRIWPGLENLFE